MVELLRAVACARAGSASPPRSPPRTTTARASPVPSRHASREELIALARAIRDLPGTVLEAIPGTGLWGEKEKALMADLSLAANRPLNWNVLAPNALAPQYTENAALRLRLCRRARRGGGRAHAARNADGAHQPRLGLHLRRLPGLGRAVPAADRGAQATAPGPGPPPHARRGRALGGRGPAARARALGEPDRRSGGARPSTSALRGRKIGEIAEGLGKAALRLHARPRDLARTC